MNQIVRTVRALTSVISSACLSPAIVCFIAFAFATRVVHAQACPPGSTQSQLDTFTTLGPFFPPLSGASISVPQFAPAPGQRLIEARITISGRDDGTAGFQNLGQVPCPNVIWTAGTGFVVHLPTNAPNLLLQITAQTSFPLAAFDGSPRFNAPDGIRLAQTALGRASTVVVDPAALADIFTGMGTVSFTLDASDNSSYSGFNNGIAVISSYASLTVDVTYIYCSTTPSQAAAPGMDACIPDQANIVACPCNAARSSPNSGCDNSAATGGAILSSSGVASLSNDTLVFNTQRELPSTASILMQGDVLLARGATFGQGVRCLAGTLERLYVKTSVNGSITAPEASDPSISARSSALGDTLVPGARRYYAVSYRDPPVLGACPTASPINITQTQEIVWVE
jgi:hypothetical protein